MQDKKYPVPAKKFEDIELKASLDENLCHKQYWVYKWFYSTTYASPHVAQVVKIYLYNLPILLHSRDRIYKLPSWSIGLGG